MICKNDKNSIYNGDEPSPKGLGYCAHAEKIGKMMIGKDSKVWIVKQQNNGVKKWIISDFYKNFDKAQKKLRKLLDKSPFKFTFYNGIENMRQYDKDEKINPLFMISFDYDELYFLSSIIFNKCAYETDFFKYVYYDGNDIGPILNKNKVKTKKDHVNISYWYYFSNDFTLWKNFEKEKKKYYKEAIEEISNNIDKIPKSIKPYIKKYFS